MQMMLCCSSFPQLAAKILMGEMKHQIRNVPMPRHVLEIGRQKLGK